MKLLIARLGSVGDILISKAAFDAARAAGHDAYLLTKEKNAFLAPFVGAKGVIAAKTSGDIFKDIALQKRAARAAALMKFDAAVDLQNNIRSRRILKISKIPVVIKYSSSPGKRRLSVLFKWFLNDKKSVEERYLKALSGAVPGIKKAKASGRKRASLKRVVIHAGAAWANKRWPYFRELSLLLLAQKGCRVCLTGAKGECGGDLEKFRAKGLRNLIGKTDFNALAGEISRATLFIGNDTAAAHLAANFNVPAVVILGPTVKSFGFITPGRFNIVEKELGCRPCHPHGGKKCPIGSFACMTDIQAGDVMAAALKLAGRVKK